MKMNAASLQDKAGWQAVNVALPQFDHAAMVAATKEHPIWVHFGAGNIFRGFIAALQQKLLNQGLSDLRPNAFPHCRKKSCRSESAAGLS